ncbi:MAG: hypothetical protein FWD66_09750 [Paludibacter sp.]|nr:hypothetical protein [Paludibacter sp.]
MQQNLQNYWELTDCEIQKSEPLQQTLKTIMQFAVAFRSISISKDHSLNFILN